MKIKFQASFNGFHLDNDSGVFYQGQELALYPKELAVLTYLVKCAGELVSKEELIDSVWNGAPTSDESIARCISVIKARFRKASNGADALIKTEYGRGYRFVGAITSQRDCLCEESFQALIDASPDFIAVKDGFGRWQVLNQAGLDLYDLQGKTWQNKTDNELAALMSPDHLAHFQACMESDEIAWKAGKPSHFTEVAQTAVSGLRIFEVIKSPIYNIDGSRRLLVVLGRDVTEKTQAEEKLKLAAQVLLNSREAVVITDADNSILSVNRAFTEVTGYTAEEVIGKNPRLLSSGRQSKEFYHMLWHQLEVEGSWRGEIWNRDKSGRIYPEWLDISMVRDQGGKVTHHIAIFSDITQRKETEQQLEFLAYHDPLTRLPNRLLLRDRFDKSSATSLRNKTTTALLFLDLDQFKNVNDTLGHEIGDQLLLGVAERLGDCVRDTDTISRLGGDEFVILLTDMQNIGMIAAIAQKVLENLATPFDIGGHILGTSFSIGIALYPDDGTDFDTLLKLADAAMYYAKDCGRNTYRFYTEQMNIRALERMQLQNNLHQALKQHEFVLHYQPQFELASGKMSGVEALIRWNSPELGLVPPAKFIPAAEDCGLIMPLGEWVLHEACRQNRRWQDEGYEPFVIAVNLSALQFRRGSIVETIAEVLEASRLSPEWLELELTESILIQNVEYVLELIRNLKKLGVGLSIDDFGTGYSSLAYLKRFAVDKLKIDQSFVRNMTIDSDDAAIVHSVIQLGHSLKLKIIAEGVETHEQVEYLQREGCDQVQGYLYSHAIPAVEMTGFMNKAEELSKTTD